MITPVMPTYGRWDVAVERGSGKPARAFDMERITGRDELLHLGQHLELVSLRRRDVVANRLDLRVNIINIDIFLRPILVKLPKAA